MVVVVMVMVVMVTATTPDTTATRGQVHVHPAAPLPDAVGLQQVIEQILSGLKVFTAHRAGFPVRSG